MTDQRALLRSLKIDRSSEVEAAPARTWPAWLGGGVIGALLAAGGFWLLGPKPEAAKPSAPAATQTAAAPVAAQPAGRLVASGFVVARRRATVASEITGRVLNVYVEEGQTVAKGQVLAELDSVLARADVARAKASVQSAEAGLASLRTELAEAERVLARTRSLEKDGFAANAALTRNQASVDSLRNQIAATQAQLAGARTEAARAESVLAKYTIRAPYGGVVVDKNAQAGEIISPVSAGGGFTRTGICTIVDMDSLELEVDVNESFIARVKPGQMVDAVLDAYPDWTIPARVIAPVPTANRDKATVRVRIGLDVKDARVLPEMAAKVTFR
jgi:HlyD family secretion protein